MIEYFLITLSAFVGGFTGTAVAAGLALKKLQDVLTPQNPMEQMMDMFPDEEVQEE